MTFLALLIALTPFFAALVVLDKLATCRCWQWHNRVTFLRAAGRYWLRVGP